MTVDIGESVMVAITIFMLTVNIALFIIPTRQKLYDHWFVDLLLKRCVLTLAFFFMALNSGIMFGMATQAGLNVANQFIFYIWFFGYGGYLMMAATMIKTIFDATRLWSENLSMKRSGDNDG